jgi:hypothetical protein
MTSTAHGTGKSSTKKFGYNRFVRWRLSTAYPTLRWARFVASYKCRFPAQGTGQKSSAVTRFHGLRFLLSKTYPFCCDRSLRQKTPLLAEDLAKLEVIHRILDPVRSPGNAAAQSRRQAALQGRLAVVWLGGSAIVC